MKTTTVDRWWLGSLVAMAGLCGCTEPLPLDCTVRNWSGAHGPNDCAGGSQSLGGTSSLSGGDSSIVDTSSAGGSSSLGGAPGTGGLQSAGGSAGASGGESTGGEPPRTECDSGTGCCDSGCVDASACAEGAIAYRDADGDGYGDPLSGRCVAELPTGYVRNSADCCDRDSQSFPGQTDYFTVPNQCGVYDYDCNGAEQSKYAFALESYADTTWATCSPLKLLHCYYATGWISPTQAVPPCGGVGSLRTTSYDSSCPASSGCFQSCACVIQIDPAAIQPCR